MTRCVLTPSWRLPKRRINEARSLVRHSQVILVKTLNSLKSDVLQNVSAQTSHTPARISASLWENMCAGKPQCLVHTMPRSCISITMCGLAGPPTSCPKRWTSRARQKFPDCASTSSFKWAKKNGKSKMESQKDDIGVV